MGGLMYEIFTSTAMVALGLYHLISTTKNYCYLKSSSASSSTPSSSSTTITSRDYNYYCARPYHPINLAGGGTRFKHIQLYLLILCLLMAFVHQIIVSSDSDPLLRGRTPVHHFTSLQSAALLFCFLLLSLALLVSESTSSYHLPPDLFFGIASALFFLHYSISSSAASVQTSDLQAKCDALSARISALISLLCLVLACQPRLFVVDVGLGASFCVHGLWALQTGLILYVDAFIPEGCHKLLDVVSGVEGSTKCDLEDSKLRAVAILDLVFVVHVLLVLLIVLFTYALVAKTVTIGRRLGAYDPLPPTLPDSSHIQMKAMAGTQA